MTNAISFFAQADNESDGDRCRYVVATVDRDALRAAMDALAALRAGSPGLGVRALVCDGCLVAAHFLDASLNVAPDGEEDDPMLSEGESAAFDADGWAVVPDSLVPGVPAARADFLEEVSDVRLVVAEDGVQVMAHWGDAALVRSWFVPSDALLPLGVPGPG